MSFIIDVIFLIWGCVFFKSWLMVVLIFLVLFDFIEIVIVIEFKIKFKNVIFWEGVKRDLFLWIVKFRDLSNVVVLCIYVIKVWGLLVKRMMLFM